MSPTPVEYAILAVRNEDYLRALTLFAEVYGSEDSVPIRTPKDASGLSYFGLALAVMQKKMKLAIDLCRRAIDLEFYNGDHYANLARVYIVGGNRKKALETIDEGLRHSPGHDYLKAVRESMGVRARPAVPFLDRAHPINVSIGQARHAKKFVEPERRKK
jgi:tetratricopeptide (TPR) repeat protein